MKQYCHYHPISPAVWQCQHCHTNYDKACMPDADAKKHTAFCPKCSYSMHAIDIHADNRPFWQANVLFGKAPLNYEALVILAFSAFLALFYTIHIAAAIICGTIIFLSVIFYACIMAQSAVDIEPNKPKLGDLLSFETFKGHVPFMLLLSVCLFSPVAMSLLTGKLAGTLTAAISLSLLPALAISYIQQHTDISASFIAIRKLQYRYFGTVLYIMSAYFLCVFTYDFSQQHLPTIMTPVITSLCFSYSTIFIFSMLAFISRQNLSQVTRVKNTPTQRPASHHISSIFDTAQNDRLEADIDIALKSGNFNRAISLLETEIKQNNFIESRRDQLFKLLMAKKDPELIEKYSELFLWLLIGQMRTVESVTLLKDLRAHNLDYQILDIKLCKVLSEILEENNEYELVTWITREAHQRFKPSIDLAEMLLSSAKILLIRFKNKKLAHEYLSYITQQFEKEPICIPANTLKKLISRDQITP